MNIHPAAVVSPTAKLSPHTTIGPFCMVEPHAVIGAGCILESGAVVKTGAVLGENNHIFEGAVIGGLPQHAHMPERPGKVIIGSGNTIRENTTIHRALDEDKATLVGDGNLIMGNIHIAHDCILGNNTIITNNSLLAGHVELGDRAYISGAVAVHQFCRIGTLAMVGGQAHVVQDIPPFVTVDGLSSLVVGLNRIGLRRAGFLVEDMRLLKAAYQVVYRAGLTWSDTLERLKSEFPEGPASLFYSFLSATERGITSERRLPPKATIKLHQDEQPEANKQAKAG
ncbi:MAG: acyl-ACP--UDP-N-acetylglucosamine O-acyltransferase [Thermoguttaceae bacterium]